LDDKVIEVRKLVRRYGKLTAVDGINLEVERGGIFGFLGPNGAGKTTTISMLTTLLKPTSGVALVGGHDVVRDQAEVRRSIGIVFQEPSLDERLTATENLTFHAVLYNIPASDRPSRIAGALRMVSLEDRAADRVERFSGGMKRRLEIARGLLHTPRVLFLDEPTLGLDPQTRRSIWEHILKLRRETDVTIFMTTHYMEEAEFCDRIAIMDRGKIVAEGTPAELKSMVGADVVTVTAQDADRVRAFAEEMDIPATGGEDGIRLEVKDGARFIPRLVGRLPDAVSSVELRRPTLDDVFLELTGRTIRESELDAKDISRDQLKRLFSSRWGGRR
jgi:ABC-2 type transport system ATP-binding protein